MPPKAKTPAPIDRPLSRAYLREFSGWSTAYPPGVSEPTSLRIMENVQINRDGSARIRPGLRYLSYSALPDDPDPGTAITDEVVGSHEAFFLADGTKAYLFAVRESDDTVGFRVLVSGLVKALSDVSLGFTLPSIPSVLNFTSATTYVKYLQIDNKIFALSNAGESMRLFYVGESKSAKLLTAIEKPAWDAADKLSVVHPEAAWIDSGDPLSVRTNLLTNPSVETNTVGWSPNANTILTRTDEVGPPEPGSYTLRLQSAPQKVNLMPSPLPAPVSSLGGWASGSQGTLSVSVSPATGWAQLHATTLGVGQARAFANSPLMGGVVPGTWYFVALDVERVTPTANTSVLVRFFSAGLAQLAQYDVDLADVNGRVSTGTPLVAPGGAVYMQIYVSVTGNGQVINFRNVVVGRWGEDGVYFDGNSGANYFWEGAAGASSSVYHPPQAVQAWSNLMPVTAGLDYTGSIYLRAGTVARGAYLSTVWYTAGGTQVDISGAAGADDTVGGWTRYDMTGNAPTVPQDPFAPLVTTQAHFVMTVNDVPRGEYHYVDAGLFEQASAVDTYFDGSTESTSTLAHTWSGAAHGSSSSETEKAAPEAVPTAETKTASTLISSTAASNIYNFGFFYVFTNEVGESAASQVTVVKTQRGWSQWKWETPNASGEPSGTDTNDPLLCADQLVATMPQSVFDQAIAQGAISWKLYMLTWSDQDPVPVTAVKVAERKLEPFSLYGSAGWLQATPAQADATAETSVLPNVATRYNYSNPSHGGQGLVASDRMVMVNDPQAQAVIRWSSNLQGSYTDFTANKGGGYKTLTSGNLYVPACVKLWQNPQSVDTLTILCMGVDGYSTGYYMAPAQVAQQSEATNVMGFEETTATPGTVSPYGCEVLNNALYHPLDELLMKSTATNYNINHSSMTDAIQDMWRRLVFKHHIVSSFHDNRLYYLVHNPSGEALEEGCWGNEIWVLDAAQKQGTWSRWLVQGQSLRKIEQGGRVMMSVSRPDGIYYFDEDYSSDDYVDTGDVLSRSIPWQLETNTQGANRSHDAWAHLQQANIVVGNFQGQMSYGLRGLDLHGKPVDVSKTVRDDAEPGDLAYDLEDFLLIRRDMKEWFFYAGSVVDDEGAVQPSSGQINLVQYRYTPSTVNTGYEFGSVETFEYGRAGNAVDARTTDNGVPMPYIDTRRP